jgi:hypothetical protein
MSVQGAVPPVGQPAINQALEPEWVRRGPASTQKAYETALAFEQTLVEQLSQSLTDTSGLEGESSQEGEPGSEGGAQSAGGGGMPSLLPQALAGGVMHAGGLGLAAELTRDLTGGQAPGAQGTEQAHAAGGTSAPGGAAATPATPTTSGGGTAA